MIRVECASSVMNTKYGQSLQDQILDISSVLVAVNNVETNIKKNTGLPLIVKKTKNIKLKLVT